MRLTLAFSLFLVTALLISGCATQAQRTAQRVATTPESEIATLAIGLRHVCLLSEGVVSCRGDNSFGQLGDGTTTDSPNFVGVRDLTEVIGMSAGAAHTCAVIRTGQIKCWGNNEDGQLGDGTTDNRSAPVIVEGISTAIQTSSSWTHTCALLAEGSIRCWGPTDLGVLGQRDQPEGVSARPVEVEGIRNAVFVETGYWQSYAILSDGSVWRWGGGITLHWQNIALVPEPIRGFPKAVSLAGGRNHLCAIVETGEVWCVGSNFYAQLGQSRQGFLDVLVKVPRLTRIKAIAAGAFHTCALDERDTVWCWGLNGGSEGLRLLGNKDFNEESSPEPLRVTMAAGARHLGAGKNRTCALLQRNQVVCWGSMEYSP